MAKKSKKKPKPGRPNLPEKLRRRGFLLKMNDEEIDRISRAAKSAKMVRGVWAREVLLRAADIEIGS